MPEPDTAETLPLIDEELSIRTEAVETGRVRVRTVVEERTEFARVDLNEERVEIEHVPIGREVEHAPAIREEGETIIVPVIEEVLVVERRLMLREEIHLRRVRDTARVEKPFALRSTRAVIEREAGGRTTPEDAKESN